VARQRFQHRHAHGDAHFDLLADQRLRAVGDERSWFLDASIMPDVVAGTTNALTKVERADARFVHDIVAY
jgi:hypothetical protein